MSKIKIEIKNKLTGKILFEYEKENNTVKDTIEEAIKQDANLEDANLEGAYLGGAYLGGANLRGANLRGAYLGGANLRGANLRGADLVGAYLGGAYLGGANLEGAYLYMWDIDDIDIKEIIENIERNSNIKIKNYYINKHILSPVTKVYWENSLIIDEYEIVEQEEEILENKLKKIEKISLTNESIEYFEKNETRHFMSTNRKDRDIYIPKINWLIEKVNYLLEKSDKE